MTNEFQVTGPPGTGKTTYLTRQVERAVEKYGPKEVVIGSLTRAAATEIRNRQVVDMPREHVGTLHSLCWHLLDKPVIADKNIKEWNEGHPGLKLTETPNRTLDDIGMPRKKGIIQTPDEILQDMNNLRAMMKPRDRWPFYVKVVADKWFDWMEANEYMDFTMLIEQALEHTRTAPGVPSVLIGDECQDWSKLELSLFRKWAKRADTVIMAGDPDQAIYTWRGADPRVFLDHPVPEENRKLLGKSYRLPSEPHKVATQWIKRIRNRVNAEFEPQREGGSVVRSNAIYKLPNQLLIREVEKEIADGRSVMILGSCKFIVKPTMDMLKRQGIPFHNPYKTDSAAWNPLRRGRKQVMGVDRILSFIKPSKDVWGDGTTEWDTEDLKRWMTILKSDGVLAHGVKKLLTKQSFSLPPDYEEFENLFADSEQAEHAVDVDLDWYMNSVLPAKQRSLEFPARVVRKRGGQALLEQPKVIVGTIHSVKGGEADTVIVYPDLSMAGWREYASGGGDGWESIIRMFYVAMTRTKDKLILCQPYSRRTVWW